MRVAVLGGGMQGCCCALALAARGARVTIYDRNDRLLSRAAIANEGKIHLGYMYANDRPGLGIDIDEIAAAKYPYRTPGGSRGNDRRLDGSIVRP